MLYQFDNPPKFYFPVLLKSEENGLMAMALSLNQKQKYT